MPVCMHLPRQLSQESSPYVLSSPWYVIVYQCPTAISFSTCTLDICRTDMMRIYRFRSKTDANEDTVFGQNIFSIVASREEYNLHFPIRRGRLNIHDGVGGSPTAVLADLAAIWSYAIKTGLGVPLSLLENYRAVLVIPALYDRPVIKHLVALLLNDLGFGGCFVVQACLS